MIEYKNKKSLIIYFSRADKNYLGGYVEKGNTEYIADYVKELTNADVFKVEPLVPYSKDYQTCIKEAKERVGSAPIKEKLKDISKYAVILHYDTNILGHYGSRTCNCHI